MSSSLGPARLPAIIGPLHVSLHRTGSPSCTAVSPHCTCLQLAYGRGKGACLRHGACNQESWLHAPCAHGRSAQVGPSLASRHNFGAPCLATVTFTIDSLQMCTPLVFECFPQAPRQVSAGGAVPGRLLLPLALQSRECALEW